jgi:hypothetical protein
MAVKKRSAGAASAKPSAEIARLRRQLLAVAEAYDQTPQQVRAIARVGRQYNLRNFDARVRDAKRLERRPPDDLYDELQKLKYKIRRLMQPDAEDLERKVPWRRQIKLDVIVSILLEILDILAKLYRRSAGRPPAA